MKWEYFILNIKSPSLILMKADGAQKLTPGSKSYKGATGKDIVEGVIWESAHKEHKHEQKILDIEAENSDALLLNTWAVLGELGWEAYSSGPSLHYFKRPLK